jgi:hypothetical protein
VKPFDIASEAYWSADAGELKSGSPDPNEITGFPSRFIAFALPATASVADG